MNKKTFLILIIFIFISNGTAAIDHDEDYETVITQPKLKSDIVSAFEQDLNAGLYSCVDDLGCTWVRSECCGNEIAISSSHKKAWNDNLNAQCADIACPDVVTKDPRSIPKCVDSRCELINVYFDSGFSSEDCFLILRDDERGFCFYDIAMQTKEHSSCLNITDEYLREDCFWQILNIGDKSEELCGATEGFGNFELSKSCWLSLSKQSANPGYCSRITGESDVGRIQNQAQCYSDVLPLVTNESQCAVFDRLDSGNPNIGYVYGKCIETVAKYQNKPLLCNNIPDIDEFYSYWFNCLINEGLVDGDIGVCREVETRTPPKNFSSAFSEKGCLKRIKKGSF